MTNSNPPPPGRDPFSDMPEVMLIRPHPGPPRLHFRNRGVDAIWSAALDTLIARHNAPTLSADALQTLGPWLIQASAEADAHLDYRQSKNHTVFNINTGEAPAFTEYFQRLPTPVLRQIHQSTLLALKRKFLAADLLRRFFPHSLSLVRPDDDWAVTLRRFLELVDDQDWFPVDWPSIKSALTEWEKNHTDDWLADFLETIPLPIFAPVEDYYPDDKVRILYGLLANSFVLTQDDLHPYGVNANRISDDQISDRLRRLLPEAVAAVFPHPLNFLPDVERVYRRDTGFVIIDLPGSDSSFAHWQDPAFTWDDDFHTVRNEWKQARPLIDRLTAFHTWGADDAHFEQAVHLLLQIGGYLPLSSPFLRQIAPWGEEVTP